MSQKQQRVPPAIQIESLGQRLRWHRLRMGLSQEALAEVLGVSARSIRRWEQDLAIPQEVARQRLCQQFGIDARQLLGALPGDETPPVSSPIWYVPFHRNPFFTGREAILQQLSSTLHSRKIATMTQALSGLGGIGKTQTALEYAYHFREHYQALLWVQADTRKLLLASIAALAAVLDLPEQRDSDQHQAVLAVQRWLRCHSQWLLIVDNLEELDLIEEFFAQAVVLGEHQPGLDCSTLIFRLMRQAELSWRQGKYEEAERLLRRAQALAEQHLGPAHPRTAEILNDLALLYCSLEKYGQAELLYQQALDVQEQQLGPRAIETLNTVNNLSLLYWKQGKYEQADPLLQRALHIREQQLGSTHPHTIQSLSNLATLYREQGRYEEAEPLYQQALQTWEQQMGPEHPDTAVMLTNLATLYRHQGKYEEAEPLYQRARCIREQQLGPEHPETAITLANLVTLYREQGRYEEAELLYQRALHSWEQQLDPEYSRIATTLNDLAILYQNQGKYEEAELLHQRARRMYEQQLEPDHPDVAVILNSLATLYQRQGRYEEAEPLYQRALEICERRLGPAHPKTVKMRDSYNCLLKKSNRATETMSDD